MTVIVTAPGLYLDIPEDEYHADTVLAPELGRSLSASGAKTLLRNPARFDYERQHPKASSAAMDLGSVAHHLVLHRGGRLLVVDAYDWKKPANQKLRDAERAKGTVVVHRGELRQAAAMARAVRKHPLAAAILSDGQPEVSVYWVDEDTGVTCRARVDWLRDNAIVDLKTTQDASPEGFGKACANYGYRESAAHYTDGVEAVTGNRLPFILIAVEKDAPHFVAVYQFGHEDLTYGADRMREALKTYAACESSGDWPGYSPDIELLSLPGWAY